MTIRQEKIVEQWKKYLEALSKCRDYTLEEPVSFHINLRGENVRVEIKKGVTVQIWRSSDALDLSLLARIYKFMAILDKELKNDAELGNILQKDFL